MLNFKDIYIAEHSLRMKPMSALREEAYLAASAESPRQNSYTALETWSECVLTASGKRRERLIKHYRRMFEKYAKRRDGSRAKHCSDRPARRRRRYHSKRRDISKAKRYDRKFDAACADVGNIMKLMECGRLLTVLTESGSVIDRVMQQAQADGLPLAFKILEHGGFRFAYGVKIARVLSDGERVPALYRQERTELAAVVNAVYPRVGQQYLDNLDKLCGKIAYRFSAERLANGMVGTVFEMNSLSYPAIEVGFSEARQQFLYAVCVAWPLPFGPERVPVVGGSIGFVNHFMSHVTNVQGEVFDLRTYAAPCSLNSISDDIARLANINEPRDSTGPVTVWPDAVSRLRLFVKRGIDDATLRLILDLLLRAMRCHYMKCIVGESGSYSSRRATLDEWERRWGYCNSTPDDMALGICKQLGISPSS